MIRRKKPKNLKEPVEKRIKRNIGGHLPYPPTDCPKKDFVKLYDNTPWLDLSICHNCPKIKNCPERKEHLLKLKGERK